MIRFIGILDIKKTECKKLLEHNYVKNGNIYVQ